MYKEHFSKEMLYKCISICDYILEDGGHTVAEASKEFRLCKEHIRRNIKIVGIASTMDEKIFDTSLNPKDLEKKFLLVQATLNKLATKNRKKINKN